MLAATAGAARVEWVAPDGSVTRRPPVSYDPIPIGTDEKEEWLLDEGRSGGGIGVAVSVENGSVSTRLGRGMSMGGRWAARDRPVHSWPDAMPPSRAGRLPVDPQGRAWVARAPEAGAPSTYDLFDGAGQRTSTVRLAPGARVVGFGAAHVYVATFDDFDLAYLQRHDLP